MRSIEVVTVGCVICGEWSASTPVTYGLDDGIRRPAVTRNRLAKSLVDHCAYSHPGREAEHPPPDFIKLKVVRPRRRAYDD